MGIEKAGIKIFNPILSKWVQKAGVKTVLRTQRPVFHGINPTLTYAPSGKSFALPRFCTQEMKQARAMNKIAIREAKAGTVEYTYPKATAEDLRRLTSLDIAESYSRVTWTNPKDGKVYHLLKQGETNDGKVVIRILDQEGAFIKEAEILPKNILVIDCFSEFSLPKLCSLIKKNPSHGEIVNKFIQKYNPFAKVDVATNPQEWAEEIIKRIKSGEKFDYINLSHGTTISSDGVSKLTQNFNKGYAKECWNELDKLLKENNRRFIIAGSNEGKEYTNYYLSLNNVEGCGSINSSGKISKFSSSRNSKYTQHYEQGEFKLEAGEKGIKILGPDIIIPYDMDCDKVGKKLEDVVITELFKNYNGTKGGETLIDKIEYYDAKCIGAGLKVNTDGKLIPVLAQDNLIGTSFSTPIRTAKLALNDMLEGIL